MLPYISHYYPEFTDSQLVLFNHFSELLFDWNKKINLISRKDTDHFELHHLIHSLSVIKFISFQKGQEILDFGTGGGLPGIPLAIALPENHFYLSDSVLKKIKIVSTIIHELGLKNVKIIHSRGENIEKKFDFIVCRAVGEMSQLLKWVFPLLKSKKNGLIFYKGGDLIEELSALNSPFKIFELKKYFAEEYFTEKKIIYL